jgi:hypothetical protein
VTEELRSKEERKKETNKQTKNQFLLLLLIIISDKKLIQNDYDPSPISDTIARISKTATN